MVTSWTMGRQVASMAREESRSTSCQGNMLEELVEPPVVEPCLPKELCLQSQSPVFQRSKHWLLAKLEEMPSRKQTSPVFSADTG